ncbi:HEPN domain-containing protein [Maribacter cobaltidurans]|uniref:Uncharacterized protein n=1 Tax=Maribacter cobaltidurans TaxID=1178778 RepID=A0A223V6U6_9FLAO|nr:HEPN domain-containing protein [Maribacter cobaltidurans]ASV30728.1 hypothetical protein CJ263_11150 [Maribacter cobaltidurans]GGD81265.1 hypothetical protein GCM10011412_18760 [Maribacter cobaltidurans]
MGRDITLYPKKASKKELKDYLENLGFKKCDHLWDWPKGTLNYSWFDYEDFKSIDGVSADIYPIDEEEKEYTKNDWALHVRNLYSASWHDVNMLNRVLRDARKNFGGDIYGDYGKNRYAPLWEDESTPLSRGIKNVYEHVDSNIKAVIYSIPEESIKNTFNTEESNEMFEFLGLNDPSRVIYNGLVPFAVSMFEYFFSQCFQILIKYDKEAIKRRDNFNQKIDFQTAIELSEDKKTIEEVIARNYTFQNLSQLNKAYKDWLNIDVRKILYKKKKVGNSIKYLENRIAEIIQYRHGIVHHFSLDRTLTKEGYINILEAIEKSINEIILFIEKKYNIKINSE